MLPSLKEAHLVNGHKKVYLARECGVNASTFYKWVTGRSRCPDHKRASVDRALGAPVNWAQYDFECAVEAGRIESAIPPKITTPHEISKLEIDVVTGDHTPINSEIDEFSALYGECA